MTTLIISMAIVQLINFVRIGILEYRQKAMAEYVDNYLADLKNKIGEVLDM